MTREDIIRMAREAWLSDKEAQLITEFDEAYISCTYLQDLQKFAALVASAEREECKKLCTWKTGNQFVDEAVAVCYRAIDQRGQA